ncbi:transmembrane protein 26 isoform X2 [Misgurnus anguillicaudatus]|uniref:transmembrane protein 26 isoform X2 n=1 Tax=Misgurnus anguillicaudatus TaxID=75329 RepID=UPI0024353F28|nr:transmembrane protein 26 isoform X2 [Misgurnus anguillicaudatus]
MAVVKFVCAIITRSFFILAALIGVWRVNMVKNDRMYWLLTVLFLPLVVEMIVTLKRRKGQEYKWFSLPIFFFLISIIPSIWILELHHQLNKSGDQQCKKLDSWDNIMSIVSSANGTMNNETLKLLQHVLINVCPNDWILGLHQFVLILLIIGKWLLPLGGGVTRDQLSQLLLIFVGTAGDILEFTSETLSDVKEINPELVYIILAVWTWSMLQFPSHLAVVTSPQNSEELKDGDGCCHFLLSRHSTDIWNIVESLFIQDGPFLVVRFIVMKQYYVFHQMLLFFTIKNFLVVILNLYRLFVICQDFRPISSSSPSTNTEL